MKLKFIPLLLLLPALMLLLTAACEQTSTSSRSPNSAANQTSSASWASKDAADHVGERGTICGPVVDTRYATGSNGKPTFLNLSLRMRMEAGENRGGDLESDGGVRI